MPIDARESGHHSRLAEVRMNDQNIQNLNQRFPGTEDDDLGQNCGGLPTAGQRAEPIDGNCILRKTEQASSRTRALRSISTKLFKKASGFGKSPWITALEMCGGDEN